MTFAWIAAEPEVRTRRWLKYDYSERRRTDDDFRAGGTPLIEDDLRAELEAYGEDVRLMPDLAGRSDGADTAWSALFAETLPEAGDYASFRGLYRLIFRGASSFTHPTTRALTRFISGGDGQFVVDVERPYAGALLTASFLLGLALLVAAEALQWPATTEDVLACLTMPNAQPP